MNEKIMIDGEATERVTIDGEANAFYDKGIHPSGTKQIEDNGIYNVTNYAGINVDVYAKVGRSRLGGIG